MCAGFALCISDLSHSGLAGPFPTSIRVIAWGLSGFSPMKQSLKSRSQDLTTPAAHADCRVHRVPCGTTAAGGRPYGHRHRQPVSWELRSAAAPLQSSGTRPLPLPPS